MRLQLTFDEWFDERFPQLSESQGALRLAFREIALDAWNASRENLSYMDI